VSCMLVTGTFVPRNYVPRNESSRGGTSLELCSLERSFPRAKVSETWDGLLSRDGIDGSRPTAELWPADYD